MQLVIRLIADLKKHEAVDKSRIYVTGLSMGGMGTFDLICRKPKDFAAAIPGFVVSKTIPTKSGIPHNPKFCIQKIVA